MSDPAPGDEPPAEMDHVAQNRALHHELDRVLTRFRKEFDLSIPAAVGILEIIKWGLLREFEGQSLPPTDTDPET